ncbi:hypothetical protein HMPREF1548_06017 [Clostridium sp. KLE 1755]|nr:hypothetical protein HMPREF1548_06017 [Clostridium sp. KLE 1755]
MAGCLQRFNCQNCFNCSGEKNLGMQKGLTSTLQNAILNL